MFPLAEPMPAPTLPENAQPQPPSREIRRLCERLFELQCALEPDPAAIDRVMRQLAQVRARAG